MKKIATLTLLFAMLAPSWGCTQATGRVHDETVVDLAVHAESDGACEAQVVRYGAAGVEDMEPVGRLLFEGHSFVSREEMELLASQRACREGAELVLVVDEGYGIPVRGSWIEVEFLRRVN